MLMRITMTIDKEVTEQQAFERYGVTDPYSTAQSMQTEAEARVKELRAEMGAEHASVLVVPIG